MDSADLNLLDPSTWIRPLSTAHREILLTTEVSYDGISSDTDAVKFYKKYYHGQKHNGEKVSRNWIRVSRSSNSLFCLPCCLFSKTSTPWGNYGEGEKGYHGYHTPLKGLQRHEESRGHIESVLDCSEYLERLKKTKTVANELHNVSEENVSRWKLILRGVLDAVLFLAENNIAFRGASEDIKSDNCGNFLNLIKLLSKYYAPLTVHVQAILNNPKATSVTYLSWESQNEFINTCGQALKETILRQISSRKYFAVMVDGTPDNSRQDQLSIILRSVSVSAEGCTILENFIEFVPTQIKTGKGLADVIIAKLDAYGLNLQDCKAQGYDNGANMAGVHNGVQAKIMEKSEDARFVPCMAHSLNLVGGNAVEKVLEAKLTLGVIQNLFVFFSSSTSGWSVLTNHCKITLKNQCATRWSAKAQAVNALSKQLAGVLDALTEISQSDTFSGDVVAAARNHLQKLKTFRFMLALKIWEQILSKINFVNKDLQNRGHDLLQAQVSISALCDWIKEYQKTGFMNAVNEATRQALELQIDLKSGFDNLRKGRGVNRKYMDGADAVELREMTSEVRFKKEFFDAVISVISAEMGKRFKEVAVIIEDFGFLFGRELINPDSRLRLERAKNLCKRYPHDLDIVAMETEMELLPSYLKKYSHSTDGVSRLQPADILDIIHRNNLVGGFLNTEIALRIFLTFPISVASNERAFSKLKLIKSYLRSSMSQDRLNSLAVLSIEKALAKQLNFDEIIDKFARIKARKVSIV